MNVKLQLEREESMENKIIIKELKYNTVNKETIEEISNYILSKEYGKTIKYTDLANKADLDITDAVQYRKMIAMMKKVKEILVNYGYVLKSIPNIGYYILKPKQVSGFAYRKYVAKIPKMLIKTEKILTNVDKKELSNERIKERNEVEELTKTLRENVETTIINSKYYSRKDYYKKLQD